MEIRKWRGERPKAFFGIKAWPSASLSLENRKMEIRKKERRTASPVHPANAAGWGGGVKTHKG
jgi:hypothetical protein